MEVSPERLSLADPSLPAPLHNVSILSPGNRKGFFYKAKCKQLHKVEFMSGFAVKWGNRGNGIRKMPSILLY